MRSMKTSNSKQNKEQLDIQDVAALLGIHWTTVRHYQNHKKHPIPHYKRDGDVLMPRNRFCKLKDEAVSRSMRGIRIVFIDTEVIAWAKKYGIGHGKEGGQS